MIIGFGNNVASALASDITATQTSFAVMPGTGAKFANLLTTDISNPDSPHGIYAKITLTDSQQTVFEICHLLSVSQDTLTVLRGQEGTQAKGWSLNDVVANFATRGSEHHFVQIEQLQAGDYTAAKAGGTANALAIMLPSTFFNNSSTDWQLNTPLVITPTVTNTGAATLQVTISGKVVGTYPLVKGNNTALQAGDIVDKSPFVTVFNSEQGRFIILNPTTEIGLVRTVNSIGPDVSGNVAIPMYGLGMGAQQKADAYNNIGEIYRVNNTSANAPTTGVAGVISLPCDGGPSTGYASVSNAGAMWAGFSTTPEKGVTWNRVYTTAYKPTAQDTGALPLTGGTCTGQIIAPNFASTPDATPVGSGTYSEQLGNQAPFFQPNWQWPVTSGGVFVPIAKGTSTRKDKGWPTAISYGYLMPGEDMHAHPVIHALGDSGMENIWEFDTQTGGLRSGKVGEFATQNWVNSRCPFPVGYFMLMGNDSDPNGLYPGTAWQDMTGAYDGRVLSLGYDALGTGGSNSVTLGVEHMPPHSHNLKAYHSNTSLDGGWSSRYSVDPSEGSEANDVITSTGGGQGFNVTNAYVHVRGWMRTA
ncbi:hypothetical protein [Serratia liquefaciens]|uniref:hypothetical protein n=1 Tax=Serratia liquefaciens TaxID=614 RepID=UPI00076B887F|nr:hypothetical protein [Serratia liquefaciens]